MEIYALAKSFDEFVKRRTHAIPGWLRARCETLSPLIFSVMDGNIQAGEGKSVKLVLLEDLKSYDWKIGMEAASILSGGGLLILGVL